MKIVIERVQRNIRKDQRGITGLETAIVLIAFVVVASVFAFAVITTGLFSSEQAQSSAQAGVEAAKSTMTPKGSMVLGEAYTTGPITGADAAGITLTDAAALFITGNAPVSVGDTVRNMTDGSASAVTVITSETVLTMLALTGGTDNQWDAADVYEVDLDHVGTIKFKVTPSPGAKPFNLSSTTTVVSFTDSNNNQNSGYLATIPFGDGATAFAATNTAYWTHEWVVGSGPAIDLGDVVEFTVNVKGLTTPLLTNSDFSVEIVPQSGAALAVSRKTPLEMTKVMDLN